MRAAAVIEAEEWPTLGDPCPTCGETLDAHNADGEPCPDCARRLSCHVCGWPDTDEGGA